MLIILLRITTIAEVVYRQIKVTRFLAGTYSVDVAREGGREMSEDLTISGFTRYVKVEVIAQISKHSSRSTHQPPKPDIA